MLVFITHTQTSYETKGVAMSQSYMLTTKDNPYNPFVDYDAWYAFDVRQGYNTCAFIARIIRDSDSLTDEENEIEYNRAMNDIISYDITGMYTRVADPGTSKIKGGGGVSR